MEYSPRENTEAGITHNMHIIYNMHIYVRII